MNVPLIAALATTLAQPSAALQKVQGRPSLVLESKAARLVVDLGGGSIVDFRLGADGLNPLSWDSGTGAGPRPRGHFLCLDRWGQPSEAEGKRGMPFHGEATAVRWKAEPSAEPQAGMVVGAMNAKLPIAGLTIHRSIALSESAGYFVVRETVANTNRLGRLYNMVQHATIAPPFLDESTLIDANGERGFAQGQPVPGPDDAPILWPEARDTAGKRVDIRRLTDNHDPGVASYIIDGPLGWFTASSAKHGLLLGYVWKTSDYGWLNAWRNVADGKPAARGLEFGTTGLHQPFPTLVKQGKIFGRSIYEYLDAGESVSRAYVGFQLRIPADFQGVAGVEFRGGALVVHERGRGPERDLRLPMAAGPLDGR